MLTPENTKEELTLILKALGKNEHPYFCKERFPVVKTRQVMTIREAMFTHPEKVSLDEANGRICRVPTVSCPPAIPIAVPGDLIDESILKLFEYYGIEEVDVMQPSVDKFLSQIGGLTTGFNAIFSLTKSRICYKIC